MAAIPIISLKGVLTSPQRWNEAANQIHEACRTTGFFSITEYPMREGLEAELDAAARTFFKLPLEEKMRIKMENGGIAWRGYFPVGGELTSGKPDIKEGIYFGEELDGKDSRVQKSIPLHGENIFPHHPRELRASILEYMSNCKKIGDLLISLVATGLQLEKEYFVSGMCADPLQLFRIFHYPPAALMPPHLRKDASLWGVGEHTDYGLLTLLKQDNVGGLEVKALDGQSWIPVPPKEGALVVNIGDMLEAITEGLYRSTPHRVRNTNPSAMRLSFPFFYDPGMLATVVPLPLNDALRQQAAEANQARLLRGVQERRWDNADVSKARGGLYGRYLLDKVSKCFPALASSHL